MVSVSSGGVVSVSGAGGLLGEDATPSPPGVWLVSVSSGGVVSVSGAEGLLGEDATPPPDPTPEGVWLVSVSSGVGVSSAGGSLPEGPTSPSTTPAPEAAP